MRTIDFRSDTVTRPTPAQDPAHPLTGECASCHSSTVSFSSGITSKPPNHIPTTQPCALCHTTPGNYVATLTVITAADNLSAAQQKLIDDTVKGITLTGVK